MRFNEKWVNSIDDEMHFWSWIGHSKILDTDGYPSIVFHGTTDNKKVFHALMEFGTYETENQRLRMLFSDDPDKVSSRHLHADYIAHADQLKTVVHHKYRSYNEYDIYPAGAYLMPAMLHMANPLRMNDDIASFTKSIRHIKARYVGILEAAGYTVPEIKKKVKGEHTEIVCSMLLDKGYDGVIFPNIAEGVGENSYMVVDPIQIYPVFGDRPKLSDILVKI